MVSQNNVCSSLVWGVYGLTKWVMIVMKMMIMMIMIMVGWMGCIVIFRRDKLFKSIQWNITTQYSSIQINFTSASILFNAKCHKLFIKAVYPFWASEKQKVSVFVTIFCNLNQLTLGALGNSHASSTKCQWGQLLLTSKTWQCAHWAEANNAQNYPILPFR